MNLIALEFPNVIHSISPGQRTQHLLVKQHYRQAKLYEKSGIIEITTLHQPSRKVLVSVNCGVVMTVDPAESATP